MRYSGGKGLSPTCIVMLVCSTLASGRMIIPISFHLFWAEQQKAQHCPDFKTKLSPFWKGLL